MRTVATPGARMPVKAGRLPSRHGGLGVERLVPADATGRANPPSSIGSLCITDVLATLWGDRCRTSLGELAEDRRLATGYPADRYDPSGTARILPAPSV